MSYNSLFGLGTHSPDAALEGWWKLDDNAASTVVTDYSGNGNHGTLRGGITTADATDTGPGGFASSAIRFNGTNQYISLPSLAIPGDDATLLLKTVVDADPPATAGRSGFGIFGEARPNNSSASHYPYTNGTVYMSAWRGESASSTLRVSDSSQPALDVWRDLCIKTTPGTDGWKCRIDDSTVFSKTGLTGLYTSGGNWELGRSRRVDATLYYMDGKVAQFSIFDRHLSDAEEAEANAGPEPLNLTAPVFSQGTYTISTTDGTWDSQANGVVNYSYSWEYADDAIGTNPVAINSNASEFSPTPAMAGKFVRVTVSAVNDGGSDPAEDQVSAWTAITAVPRGLSKEVAHWCPSWRDDSAESVVTDYTLNGYDMNTVNMNSSNWIADTSEGGVRALDFNGTNEYCRTDLNNVPYSSLDAQLQTSVSAWVYGELTSTNGNPWAYAKTQGGSSTRRAGYRLVDRGGDEVGQCAFSSNDGNSSATVSVKPANGSQPRSTWYHVYAEFEKSAVGDNQNASTRLWLDGVYIGEDSDTTGIFDDEPLHRMFLGQNTRTAGNLETTYFDGRLDDIRFFGEHLTQNEITHLASARGVEGSPGGGGPTFQPAWAFQATVVAL